MSSVFATFRPTAWPVEYKGQLTLPVIVGGIPSSDKVAEGWIRSKLGLDNDRIIQEAVLATMAERGVDANEAAKIVNEMKNLNGFKRDKVGLFIEGRQLKAALKEAANVAVAAGKLNPRGWGVTNKGLLGFLAEHVFVVEDRLYLLDAEGNNVKEATGINQRFVSTFRGTGIQYEEYVSDAVINFSVQTDYPFTEKQWAMIFLTGEMQGLGASRSQGYGRYEITAWNEVRNNLPKKAKVTEDDEDMDEDKPAAKPRASKAPSARRSAVSQMPDHYPAI